VPEDSTAMTQETFGPTLAINKVMNTDEAIKLSNASSYGLAAAVFSKREGEKIASKLACGMVSINSVFLFAAIAAVPFGGVKDSGYGRIHGGEGLLEYVGPLVETQLQEKPLSIALREINSKLLKTEHVDPEVLAQEEIEMEQRRLAAIQAQQRYNAGYDNSFAGVYEDSFDETAEVAAEASDVVEDAAVVADNTEGNDDVTEETVS